jgi:hypothetical protein
VPKLTQGANVSPSLLYRVASVLLVLFGLGHQLGFRRIDPRWGVDSALGALKATQFEVQGMTRTYWDFFSGFGFFVTVLLFFAAVLAFQLGGLPNETLRRLSLVRWAFALSFVVITGLTWRYFFVAPLVLASLVALCLVAAAGSVAKA